MAASEKGNELLEAQKLVWKHTCGFISTSSIQCAVQLGIPEIIHNHGQPMTLSKLIANLDINLSKASFISRLMRFMIHLGFFTQQEQGYTLTLAGRYLLKDGPHPLSQAFFIPTYATKSFDLVVDWLRNNDPTAFHTAFGKSFWERIAQNPEEDYLFNKSMTTDSNLVTNVLINECKHVFNGLTSLVDVGGGLGAVSRAVSGVFPDLKCTVLDQPHVVADLEGTTNLKFVGGDMFHKIPSANAVLLKSILHDWSDEECVKILKKCKEAIPSKEKGGKLIIIEIVIEDENEDKDWSGVQLLFDMTMFALVGGKERNREEWKRLFVDAEFSGYKIIAGLGLPSLIEV